MSGFMSDLSGFKGTLWKTNVIITGTDDADKTDSRTTVEDKESWTVIWIIALRNIK